MMPVKKLPKAQLCKAHFFRAVRVRVHEIKIWSGFDRGCPHTRALQAIKIACAIYPYLYLSLLCPCKYDYIHAEQSTRFFFFTSTLI